MLTPPHKKRCNCQGTCDHSWTTYSDTQSYYNDAPSESDKRAVEEKMNRLEKKEELKQTQHWKHKNKPKF